MPERVTLVERRAQRLKPRVPARPVRAAGLARGQSGLVRSGPWIGRFLASLPVRPTRPPSVAATTGVTIPVIRPAILGPGPAALTARSLALFIRPRPT